MPVDCIFYGEVTTNGALIGPGTLNGMELELARRESNIRRCVAHRACRDDTRHAAHTHVHVERLGFLSIGLIVSRQLD